MKEIFLFFIMLAAFVSCEQLYRINSQLKIDCSSRPNCEQAMELEEQRLAEIAAQKAAERAAERAAE